MSLELSDIDSNRVSTNGYQTHYLEAGTGDPVVLIHGGGAGADSRSNWAACIPLFAKNCHVYAMDMVGFGESDKPHPDVFTYDQDARTSQLIAFIESLGLAAVNVVGNSMGGYTALGLAMKRPDLVRNLVLMGSAGLNRTLSDALRPVTEYDFTYAGMQALIAVLTNPTYKPTEEMVRYRHELSIRGDAREAYRAIMRWVKERGGLHYPEEDIAAIGTRTLVFNGKDDLVIPMEEAFQFLRLIRNSTGYFLADCRHWAMIEYPEVFAKVTLDFIEGYAD